VSISSHRVESGQEFGRHAVEKSVEKSVEQSLEVPEMAEVQISSLPTVSVIVAVFNEARHVDDLVASIFAQDLNEPLELLLVDGGSTDETRQKIHDLLARPSPAGRTLRLLENPQRRAPFAFNVGIDAAQGEFFALFGAHANYEPNYLSACIDFIRRSPNRVACGGTVRSEPLTQSLQNRVVVDVLSNTFASSKDSFRTHGAGEVDNISFPVLRTAEIRSVGGYNEELFRNQDNEMNGRLLANGVHLHLIDATSASYFPVQTVRALLGYARRNGWWNAKTVALGLSGLKTRHFVPAAFTAGTIGAVALSLGAQGPLRKLGTSGLLGAYTFHLGLAANASRAQKGFTRGVEKVLLPPLIAAFHLCYGFGTLSFLVQKTEPGTSNRKKSSR
jgi:glycosyltransferase involved in cell wall biosynthesis